MSPADREILAGMLADAVVTGAFETLKLLEFQIEPPLARLLVHVLLAASIPSAFGSDAQLTSWLTAYAGKYARG